MQHFVPTVQALFVLSILAFPRITQGAELSCKNAYSANLNTDGQIALQATDLVLGYQSCCLGGLLFEISDQLGNFGPSTVLDCDQLGQTFVAVRLTDCLGNVTTCETFVIVQDNFDVCGIGCAPCCLPDVRARAAVVSLSENNTTTVQASWLDDGSFSSCSGGNLTFSFSPDPADGSRTFTCDDLGLQFLPLWVTDMVGNQAFAMANVIVQDCFNDCPGAGPCRPTIVVHNGLVAELGPDGVACLSANEFDLASQPAACNGATALSLAFSDDPADSLRCFTCDDIGQQAIYIHALDDQGAVAKAETFIIVEDNAQGCVGPLALLPPNDEVCNAISLDGLLDWGCQTQFFNIGATVGNNEQAPPLGGCTDPGTWCDNGAEHTVWFTFTAPPNELVTITAAGMDTQLALWQAADCAGMENGTATLVAANDDSPGGPTSGSVIEVGCLEVGLTYFLQMDGSEGAEGFFDLTVTWQGDSCTASPAPDLRPEAMEVAVFPNPASDKVSIRWVPSHARSATWVLCDALGRVVLQVPVVAGHAQADLSGLADGIYFYKIQSEGKRCSAGRLVIH